MFKDGLHICASVHGWRFDYGKILTKSHVTFGMFPAFREPPY
ncbi:uncharacterized protein METZ01_LOCUS333987 [marine metagenome]|uniref:Uncharacterized protein n=1 Tax=marine metagenome TaxID=408172 RepID=A0A382Q6B6_9ZZZZ